MLLGRWAGADSTEQLANVADLKRHKFIAEAEFEWQKARVLA